MYKVYGMFIDVCISFVYVVPCFAFAVQASDVTESLSFPPTRRC